MQASPLIAPVVALVAWTLLVMGWMAVTRAAAFRKLGITLKTIPPGSRGAALEQAAPEAQWKAHNYMHLMEQPTIFYAIVFALVLLGDNEALNLWLAWGYVGFRILHSLVQGTVNIVAYRFPLFALSSLCLLGLTIHAIVYLSPISG